MLSLRFNINALFIKELYMSSIKQRIQELKQEIEKVKFELALKENALKELEAVSGRKKSRTTNRKNKPPRKGSLAEHLVEVLKDSDTPISVAKIVEKLEERGYSSNAKVGLNNLVPSALSRRPDLFFRPRHGVYGLKSKHEQLNQ
jgi:hypothetical protein